MIPYMKNGTQSEMRKKTNLKKSNQIPIHENKIIDIDRMKLL